MNSNKYFEDYDAFTESEILEITQQGISLRNGVFIDFGECISNFQREHPGSSNKCVGEREISDYSFTFYASPKPVMIKFLEKGKARLFFSKNTASNRFHNLQNRITELGYQTYDVS